MPLLPLPPDAPIGGGDLPVTDTPDVALQEANFVRAPNTATTRDAVRSAITKMALAYQRCSERAAAQVDTRRATGIYLDGLGSDKKVFRQTDEAQEPYRTRVLVPPGVVDPFDIVTAVNALLAPYTTIQCKYLESILDAFYLTNGAATYDSFFGVTPHYQDRLYPDDAAENNGRSISYRSSGGAWMFSDALGRYFVLRVPDLSPLDDDVGYMSDGSTDQETNFWLTDGSATDPVQSFLLGKLSTDIYQGIINTVERIVGASMRWMLYADPTLT